MAKAVFVSNPVSKYDDLPDKYYHFPKTYLSRVEQTVGDNIVYYGAIDGRLGRYYFATGRVTAVRPDLTRPDHYYADIKDYVDFIPVEYRQHGGYERKLILPDGTVNGGTAQAAVRIITTMEFDRILEAGLEPAKMWPMRDAGAPLTPEIPGFAEDPQPMIERPAIQLITNKKYRDARFRQNVLDAYDRRCAFTGLRLINGGGRPEVEAAHIIPVEVNGTDSTRNGIALSGTVHWMFDRGMLSIADDFTILKSRHINYDVDHLLNKDLKALVPHPAHLKPHPIYLKWHRENVLKV